MLASKFLSAATRRGVLQIRNMGGHAQTVVAAPLMSPAEISAQMAKIASTDMSTMLRAASAKGTGKAAPEFTRNLGKRMILRATGGCLLAAAITSGIYFYYGCYVQVNQFQEWNTNCDQVARGRRIVLNQNHWANKMEYWWRTGIWVGPEMAPIPADHKPLPLIKRSEVWGAAGGEADDDE